MNELKHYLLEKREFIESKLITLFKTQADCFTSPLTEAMSYSILAGGKRIRPILCIATAESLGENQETCINTACALEMIHTYSLIHDDLPGMDNDNLRRGKPTCHIRFDEATAILAGDALLTLAFQFLSKPSKHSSPEASILLKIIHSISKAVGYHGMVEGQMQDILSEGKAINTETLQNIHNLKTGQMIEVSVLTGALIGNADEKQLSHLRTYSNKIGLAFQVMDDILNVTGDSSVMGKAVGTDEFLNKATYPALLGLEKSIDFSNELVADAIKALDIFDHKAEPLRALASYIIARKR